jgi:hypothetical protein
MQIVLHFPGFESGNSRVRIWHPGFEHVNSRARIWQSRVRIWHPGFESVNSRVRIYKSRVRFWQFPGWNLAIPGSNLANPGFESGNLPSLPGSNLTISPTSWVRIWQSPQPTEDRLSFVGLPSGTVLNCRLFFEGRQKRTNTRKDFWSNNNN